MHFDKLRYICTTDSHTTNHLATYVLFWVCSIVTCSIVTFQVLFWVSRQPPKHIWLTLPFLFLIQRVGNILLPYGIHTLFSFYLNDLYHDHWHCSTILCSHLLMSKANDQEGSQVLSGAAFHKQWSLLSSSKQFWRSHSIRAWTFLLIITGWSCTGLHLYFFTLSRWHTRRCINWNIASFLYMWGWCTGTLNFSCQTHSCNLLKSTHF